MNEATPQQQRVMAARGNALVAAGAGAGKTRTLVERCLGWILDTREQGSVDEILMVTFTEAAAAEMRQRLRQGLQAAFEAAPSERLQEQLALLETAHISTLHSFCFHLVSQHFFDAGLEAPPNVLSNERARLLASEALDGVLDKVYDGKIAGAAAMQELVKSLGGDWDRPARQLVGRVHAYRQSLPQPEEWLRGQRERFAEPQATAWRRLLGTGLEEWRDWWGAILQARAAKNSMAAKCAGVLASLKACPGLTEWAAALELLSKLQAPRGKASEKEALKEIFADAAFLASLCATGKGDPVQQDWDWARGPMLALLDLTEAFGRAYAAAKRALGGLDFQDLEQLALGLLWRDGRPSAIAGQWRQKFRLIFVDEYQDINGAQEAIIQALGREGAGANRFLVGDVKQSIYRFRLADPGIFQEQRRQWEKAGGEVYYLTENFRSHESILRFVNGLFGALMREEMGGAHYDESQRLVFGNRAGRAAILDTEGGAPRIELHLRPPTARFRLDEDEENLSDAEHEARIIGRRLREWKNAGVIVNTKEGPRPAEWSDMAILLRAPRLKVEAYVKTFARLEIPLVAARAGFYDTLEARDLLNLLQILDNPLQDLPLLAVLRSPFGGLTPRELAQVRMGREKSRFWTALLEWHKGQRDKAEGAAAKVDAFLQRFQAWRRASRQEGVANILERALDETDYLAWLEAEERPEQRRANVERFLQLTRDYDAERGEGLYRFLKLVEAQQENEIDLEPAAAPLANAVRLMSIHQSKGLEFPIVAVGDLGKRFNYADANGRVVLDENLGLCPQIRAPGGAQFYPSIAQWLARRRQRRETQSEEMRLLYVALTRAMERLLLVGSVAESRMEKVWPEMAEAIDTVEGAARGHSYLDWIGAWLRGPHDEKAAPHVIFHVVSQVSAETPEPIKPGAMDDISLEVRARMDWAYSFPEAASQAAKTSVSALRRELAELDTEEAVSWFASGGKNQPGGAEIGSAHHKFLEMASLEKLASNEGAAFEAARLCKAGRLTAEQVAALDMEGVAAFWRSEAGRAMLGQNEYLRRELAFTARFARAELAEAGLPFLGVASAEGEFVVVQGAVDLAAILPGEIWIVDFKTDQFSREALAEKTALYRPQLRLYGAALARIYRRPVTRLWLCFLRQREIVLL